jgi:hypothetical protein
MKPARSLESSPRGSAVRPEESWIQQAMRGLRYGSVEVRIHDGKIVQVERREKFRPPSPADSETLP